MRQYLENGRRYMYMYVQSYYTVFRKNTHSHFLLCLHGKCLDLHKIFRVCLWGIKYSMDVILTSFLHVCEIMGFTIEDKDLIKCLRVSSSNEYLIWLQWNVWLLANIPWKFCTNWNIFHRDIKENASVCFFCLNIRQKHPLAFSLISRWKMFQFV